jgi:SAM-dependent methyltransferase
VLIEVREAAVRDENGEHEEERAGCGGRERDEASSQADIVQDAAAMWMPTFEPEAAATLGRALRSVGYTTDAIEKLLGEDGPSADLDDVPVLARRLPASRLATIVRVCLLQLPVAEDAAAAAFGAGGVDALVALGFASESNGEVVPRARIVPTEGVYLSFDGFSRGAEDPPGWVASFTPTAYWLASLTVRRQAARGLDIGTGNGAHALLAARHAGHVVATDVNERALAFTNISAALNGIANVETRLGSLFDPVDGETFDLITCNAPYVVSPESRWAYRDGGFDGDELSRRVVTEAAAHLAEGGFASMLVSWLAASEDDPDERIESWLDGSGCDAWILGLSGADPLEHAAGWNDHLTSDELAVALDEWTGYLRELGANWVSEGGVVLRRRSGTRNVVRADAVDEDELEYAGEQLERVFDAFALLAEEGNGVIEELTLRLAEDTRLVEEIDRDGDVVSATFRLEEGTWPELDVDAAVADVLLAFGDGRTIDEAVAQTGESVPEGLRNAVLDLLELGFLEVAG